jgi:hypothetical protein
LGGWIPNGLLNVHGGDFELDTVLLQICLPVVYQGLIALWVLQVLDLGRQLVGLPWPGIHGSRPWHSLRFVFLFVGKTEFFHFHIEVAENIHGILRAVVQILVFDLDCPRFH